MSSRGIALAVGALLIHGACRAPEDAFTERVVARAREMHPDATIAVKERFHLEITAKDDAQHQMFLDNLWRHCQASATTCDESMARSLAIAAQGQATSDTFVKAELVSRPFLADMFVVYAFDLPDGMRMMSRENLAALKLDDERVHALALANLEKETPEMAAEAVEPGSPIRVLHVGDSYDAIRVILHDRWKSIAAGVKGDLIVAVPSRDFVYFTGSREDLPGLRALARRAAAESDHAVSAALLRWKADGWEALP